MGSLYKRGRVWWFKLHGDRQSTKCTDRKAAEIVYANAQRAAVDPTYRPPDATTLEQALESFEAQQKQRGRAEGTVKQYGVHASHLARLLGEHTPIARIAAPEVDGYLATRHKEGAARGTQHKELCTLRGALKLARRHGKYPHALDQVMPHDFEHTYKPLERHLTLDQVRLLISALPANRAAPIAFIIAFAADWRSVEIAQPGDIDLKHGRALIRGSKNPHRWRTIPILPQFKVWAEVAAKGLPFEPWTNVRRDLEVACRRAEELANEGRDPKLPRIEIPKVTPRDLRRSHARALRAKGVEPHLIGKMLGHVDSRMVERVYGQLPPEALAELMKARLGTTRSQRKPKKAKKTDKTANP